MADVKTGVTIIRTLLANNVALVALCPAARIMAGDLPLNVALPAISITQIDSMPRNTVSMSEAGGLVFHTDRVQVTVFVKAASATPDGGGYPALRELMRAVFAACPAVRGAISGANVDSVLPDLEGPDLSDTEKGILSRSRDFVVKYNA